MDSGGNSSNGQEDFSENSLLSLTNWDYFMSKETIDTDT